MAATTAPAEVPIPYWIVETKAIPVPPTPKKPVATEKQTYYWKLRDPGSVRIPRFYPADFGKPDKPNWYFLPERFWTNRNNQHFKPFSHGKVIENARQLSKSGARSVAAENMADVKSRLELGQINYPKNKKKVGAKKVNSPLTGPDHDDTSHGRYLTFDKAAIVDDNTLYVRIRDKDVGLMSTGGGRDQPEEIYMTCELIDRFVASKDGASGTRFEIRTADGCGRIFEMDERVSITKAEWKARRERAINSIDKDGGWNRMINPDLKLYLVSVSPDWAKTFTDIVKEVVAEGAGITPRCLQAVEVLTPAQKDRHPDGPFTLVATSPFNQYETWIRSEVYTQFQVARKDREMPATRKALLEIGEIVDGRPKHKTAASQKRVVQAAFDDANLDQISTAVSAEKIATARGTRGNTLAQKEVMGGVSATDIAVKLAWTKPSDRVQWSGNWPATGLFPAEWLHRCAYSWGGLGEAGNIHSSQLRENLVFGTSECNSVMTRYEKSWQRLVTLERELRGEKFAWMLQSRTTRCNPTENAIEGGVTSLPKQKTDPPTPTSVRWMCKSIEYTMDIRKCELLGCTSNLRTVFYPFQRGFFTLLEQRIDAAILTNLFKTRKGAPPLTGIHPDDEITFQDIDKEEDALVNDSITPKSNDEKVKPWGDDEMLIEKVKDLNLFKPSIPIKQYGNAGNQVPVGNSQHSDPTTPNSNYGDAGLWGGKTVNKEEKDPTHYIPMNESMISGKNLPEWNPLQNDSTTSENNGGKGVKMVIEQEKNLNTVTPSTPEKQHGNAGNKVPAGNTNSSNYYSDPAAHQNMKWAFTDNVGWGGPKEETEPSAQGDQYGGSGGKTLGSYSKQAPNPASGLLDSQNVFFLHENSAKNSGKGQSPQPGSLSSLNSLSFLSGGNSLSFFGGSGIQSFNPAPSTTSASNGSKPKVDKKATDGSQSYDAETQSHLLNSMFFGFGPQVGEQAPPEPPVEHVAKVPFALFGLIPAELQMLQSPSLKAGIHQRVTLPGTLSLGTLLPSLAGSPLDAIMLLDTTLTYRSKRTPTVPAGLTLATTIQLSGFLDPVNTVLRDVFHQKKPRINVSGLISTQPDALKEVPAPSGFTLRGELPEVNINLFGVLDITNLGVSIMGRRKGSAGGYDYAYGFDGRGKIADIELDFSLSKDRDYYQIFLAMTGEIWKNVGGVVGINLENVQFEASWKGTNLSSVELQLQATFKLRTASMLLRGLYSKTNYELAGTLHDADLTMLQHLYEDIFNTTIATKTEHTIVFSTLSFLISKSSGITLSGAVTIDGHTSAEATIELSTAGIHITGSVESVIIPGGHVTVESASLDLTISREEFIVKLAGCVTVNEMTFEVALYLNKTSGSDLEYTLYGRYQGNLYLRNIVRSFEGTFMDVSLQKVALIVSNMKTPVVEMKENVFAYPVTKGLQIFAEATRIKPMSQLLRLEEKPIQLCAFYTPGSGSKSGSFGVGLTLPTTDLITFDCMRSGPLTLKLYVVNNSPHIALSADIYITVAKRKDPLILQLTLDVNATGAEGSAKMIGMWENPFDMNPDLSFGDIEVGLGIQYATFFTTGTPSSLTFGGSFVLGPPTSKLLPPPGTAQPTTPQVLPTTGDVLLHLTNNPTQQLVSIDFTDLDVAALSRLLARLGGCEISVTPGSDTLYFDMLTVYLSTGVVHRGVDYPAGMRFQANMRVFGKTATMHAELSGEKVVIKGGIQGFQLGDLVVSGVTLPDPSIDIELSSGVQKVRIDGLVVIGQNKVLVDVHVEYAPVQMFHFYILVKFVDSYKLEIKATLEGEVSKDVDGREFNLLATMEQDLVDYIGNLANNHIANEKQDGRKESLEREAAEARKKFEVMFLEYKDKQNQCAFEVQKVESEQEMTRLTIREKMVVAEGKLQAFRVATETEERELNGQIQRDREQRKVDEQMKTTFLAVAIQCLAVAELELERAALGISQRERTMEAATEAKLLATDELGQFEAECAADLANEPSTSDPANTVWEWARRELMRQLEQKRAALHSANADHDAARAAFKPSDSLQIVQEQLNHKAHMTKTMDELKTHQETAEARSARFEQAANDQLSRLRTESGRELAVLIAALAAIQQEEAAFLSTENLILETARTANNIEARAEHAEMVKLRKAFEETDMASRSFNNLQQITSVWGPMETEPLQYALKTVAGQLLTIKKVTVIGKWCKMAKDGGKLSATVEAILGLVDVVLDVSFQIDDILGFFTSLWMAIGDVINSVAGTMKYIVEMGTKVVEDLIKDVANGVGIAIEEGRKFIKVIDETLDDVTEGVKEVGKQVVDTLGDAVDDAKKIGKVLGYPVEEIVDQVEDYTRDALKTVDDAFDAVNRLGESLEEFDRELDQSGKNCERRIEDAFDNFGHSERDLVDHLVQVGKSEERLGHTLQNQVEKWDHFGEDAFRRLENTHDEDREQELMRVLMDSQVRAMETLETIGNAAQDFERDVGQALEDVGNEVEHLTHEVIGAVEETLDDIGNAFMRIWS